METQDFIPDTDYHQLERRKTFFHNVDLIRAKLCQIYDVQGQQPDTILEEKEISPERSTSVSMDEGGQGPLKNLLIKFASLRTVARQILESDRFTYFMIAMIVLSTVVLMIQTDISSNNPKLEQMFSAINWFVLAVFTFEIVLKWIDNFRQFWKSMWNIFDVVVTILSVLPDILATFSVGKNSLYLSYLALFRQFRILRTFKIVSRFRHIRVTVLAVFRAFQNLIPCLYLMFILMYIFSILGHPTFENYSQCSSNLTFCSSFKDVGESFNTLFLIFTMELWSSVLIESWQVPEQNDTVSGLYIIGWLFIGAFMIQSVILGTLSSTFQDVRKELTEDIHQVEVHQKAELLKAECWKMTGLCAEEEEEEMSEYTSDRKTTKKADWETSFLNSIEVILESEEEVTWTGKSLVSFFECMELLQHDLAPLQQLAVQALLDVDNS